VRRSCEYYVALAALDVVAVPMRLAELVQNRVTLSFEYWRLVKGREELVACGEQQVAAVRREGGQLAPTAVPAALREALAAYR
jgi:enediyne biosynthesis thioesterase